MAELNKFEEYLGDSEYSILCVGDAVAGDEIAFRRPKFRWCCGGFMLGFSKFDHYEMVVAKVAKVTKRTTSKTGLINYSLEIIGSKSSKITEKNLYSQKIYRKPWVDEVARKAIAKQNRMQLAREAAAVNSTADMFGFMNE